MKEKTEQGQFTPATAEYGYYSKLLNKPFDTLEELKAAEDTHRKELEKKEQLANEKRVRAKEVEEAYAHSMQVRKEAQEMIRKADDEYYKLRTDFIKDYGSFHMTFSDNNGKKAVTVSDVIDSMFNFWF